MTTNLYAFDRAIKEIDRLYEEYNVISYNIERLTDQIKEHRAELKKMKIFPPAGGRNKEKYHQWRQKSISLHHHRSGLKDRRMVIFEKINTLLMADEAA